MTNETTRLVIRTPDDAIAAVPYLLGFHPVDSLVVLGFDGPENTCAVRVDLPPDPSCVPHMAEQIAVVVARNHFRSALIVGYGPSAPVTAVASAVWEALASAGVRIVEAMRVADDRWWSLTCLDECCPPEGRPFDTSTTELAANAAYAGHAALPDRDDLRRSVEPPTGKAQSAVRRATLEAEARVHRWAAEEPTSEALTARMSKEAVGLFEALRASDHPPTDADAAMLTVLMTDLRVRDEIWVRLTQDDPKRDLALWRAILRRADTRHAAAPAALLAFLAYTTGDGGLANVALDRAEEADPHYSMAALIRAIIALGVPPKKARLKITPEELSTLYKARDTPRPPATAPQPTEPPTPTTHSPPP
ncbi:DUF4192 domain-containing protein [Actinomadura logoneensis]|uniref:DUF4192 domain-containing protein n=1 Tax=Actinomadura logoneensis TaxID=2293572 RepID=A0A372JSF9_9ACTN|nr:DUF4192 domain-containing protein [Actinomadura logoneensis]RFU42704.1 DUF4192 domain-containing protein [Actinomadura logoneensis]